MLQILQWWETRQEPLEGLEAETKGRPGGLRPEAPRP